MYGQPDSLDFFLIGILCPPGLNYNKNRPIGWFCVEGVLLESNLSGILFLRAYKHFKCVICFGLGVRIWRSPSTSNATKGCRSDVKLQSSHKFQHSLWTMNATMKVNGKFWILAGFKEGLSLGDRTSAESTLLTWGVNSVWSNLNSWREEWRQHQTLYKSLQVNSSI